MSENHGSSLCIKNGVGFVVVGAVDDAVIHYFVDFAPTLRVIGRRNFYGEDLFFSLTKGNRKSGRFSNFLLAFYI